MQVRYSNGKSKNNNSGSSGSNNRETVASIVIINNIIIITYIIIKKYLYYYCAIVRHRRKYSIVEYVDVHVLFLTVKYGSTYSKKWVDACFSLYFPLFQVLKFWVYRVLMLFYTVNWPFTYSKSEYLSLRRKGMSMASAQHQFLQHLIMNTRHNIPKNLMEYKTTQH